MAKELIMTGKSVEEAVEKACSELGTVQEKCTIEVLQKPKKSLFGILKTEAQVKVTVNEVIKVDVTPDAELVSEKPNKMEEKTNAAVEYLESIMKHMGFDEVKISVDMKEESAMLTLEGENLGVLIGRHGETLDALQYLTSLVCNRIDGKYYRITVNCGNYRKKREDALKELAKKISAKVKRTGRSQMLEPMNPYERRIIHSEISGIEGIVSKSKGDEPNRRIVILSTEKKRGGYNNNRRNNSGRGGYQKRKPERTMEEILKADRSETEKKAQLYSKIEL